MEQESSSTPSTSDSSESTPTRKRAPRRVSSATTEITAPAETDKPSEPKTAEESERPKRRRSSAPAKTEASEASGSEGSDSNDSSDDGAEAGGARSRNSGNSRGRGRDRRRGRGSFGEEGEPEVSDDDVLIPIGGILDVLDNYAFVRTQGYLPGPTDVYVSLGQVKKYNLRKGDAVIGAIRQPRDGEHQGRQKYNALVSVDTVNGQSVDEAGARSEFSALRAVYPTEQLRMETSSDVLGTRMVDLFAPVAKGQRAVIVGATKTGKSDLVQAMAQAVAQNAPDAHLMVVLIDEQPETISDVQRDAKGEVIASSFDRSVDDHTTIAELAIERAKRLVELGHDVVVVMDSLTRLARAYQLGLGGGSRTGAMDTAWVYPTKKLFGAARNIEGGGSLTMLATLVTETGLAMDDVVASEISAAATMELTLDAHAAGARVFPAMNIARSGTRKEEAILGKDEVAALAVIRQKLAGHSTLEGLQAVVKTLSSSSSNVEALVSLQKNLGS
ncbi:transcription termination factor Rho [Pontimonas sp.]|jgi:transcription termination factor Rho|nr:transcription termination factor Rho [Pontimonas sp.]MDA8900933.1 transcription termination factor Rho [Pontimonas sp.]|tara:strand:+ start:4257 stop:5759 length:1503 start_codon:yes stop_codon:yes gene_type:complete